MISWTIKLVKQYHLHTAILSSVLVRGTVVSSYVVAKSSISWFARAVNMNKALLLTIFMLSAAKIQKKKKVMRRRWVRNRLLK